MKNCFFLFIFLKAFIINAEEMNNSKLVAFGNELKVLHLKLSTQPMDLVTAVRDLTSDVLNPEHFGESFLRKIEECQKKDSNGEYVEYWDNGQIKFKGSWKNGFADGHIHGWFSDGTDALKAFFKEGVKVGIQIVFYPNLSRRESKIARLYSFNEEGLLHGEQITFYSKNRQLEAAFDFIQGFLDGEACYIIIDEEGNKITENLWYKTGELVRSEIIKSEAKKR